jgi:hypothetical protein
MEHSLVERCSQLCVIVMASWDIKSGQLWIYYERFVTIVHVRVRVVTHSVPNIFVLILGR